MQVEFSCKRSGLQLRASKLHTYRVVSSFVWLWHLNSHSVVGKRKLFHGRHNAWHRGSVFLGPESWWHQRIFFQKIVWHNPDKYASHTIETTQRPTKANGSSNAGSMFKIHWNLQCHIPKRKKVVIDLQYHAEYQKLWGNLFSATNTHVRLPQDCTHFMHTIFHQMSMHLVWRGIWVFLLAAKKPQIHGRHIHFLLEKNDIHTAGSVGWCGVVKG